MQISVFFFETLVINHLCPHIYINIYGPAGRPTVRLSLC